MESDFLIHTIHHPSLCVKKHAIGLASEVLLKMAQINTPLGRMLALADDHRLYLLEFIEAPKLQRKIHKIKNKMNFRVTQGYSDPIQSVENELKKYFNCSLDEFKTPIVCLGTPFQQLVWAELKKIPYGETRSYHEIAINIRHPKACRAIANANGANSFAIMIPCHRVIYENGQLGGYSGGIMNKQWLIKQEQQNKLSGIA